MEIRILVRRYSRLPRSLSPRPSNCCLIVGYSCSDASCSSTNALPLEVFLLYAPSNATSITTPLLSPCGHRCLRPRHLILLTPMTRRATPPAEDVEVSFHPFLGLLLPSVCCVLVSLASKTCCSEVILTRRTRLTSLPSQDLQVVSFLPSLGALSLSFGCCLHSFLSMSCGPLDFSVSRCLPSYLAASLAASLASVLHMRDHDDMYLFVC